VFFKTVNVRGCGKWVRGNGQWGVKVKIEKRKFSRGKGRSENVPNETCADAAPFSSCCSFSVSSYKSAKLAQRKVQKVRKE